MVKAETFVSKTSAVSETQDHDIENDSNSRVYRATDESIEKAAMYIMDAWDGKTTAHDTSHDSFKIYKFLHRTWWTILHSVIVLVFAFQIFLPEEYGVDALGWKTVHRIVEVLLFLVVGLDIALMRKLYLGSSSDSDETLKVGDLKWVQFRLALLLVTALDFTLSVVTDGKIARFSTFSRLFFLVFRNLKLRTAFIGCLIAGTQICKVLLLICCDVLFFGFVGFVLFGKIDTTGNFDTPLNGMRTMLLVLTAPGTVLSDLAHLFAASDGLASYFFVIFIIITTMVFQKLVLATAYRSYKEYQKIQYHKVLRNYEVAARKAYSIVAPFGSLKRKTWHRVFENSRETIIHWWQMLYLTQSMKTIVLFLEMVILNLNHF